MSGQGDHFVQTNSWFASHFEWTCTLLMDLNLFIFFLFKLLCLNYPPGLNHHIIFNILDMTPKTSELIFFGWSERPATVKKLFFFLPRLLSKDIIAVVLYFMYILHFWHVYPYFRNLLALLKYLFWPLLVVNYLFQNKLRLCKTAATLDFWGFLLFSERVWFSSMNIASKMSC